MGRLENAYDSVFQGRSSKGQLYTGFYLFLGGVALGLAAIVLLFIADQQGNQYDWRKAAFVVAELAGAILFFGVFWTLPTKRPMRIASSIGLLLCLVATVLFWFHYPVHFNVAGSGQDDYTALDVGLYALGLAILLAGTFTSLIGYYVDRVSGAAAARGSGELDVSASEYQYDIPDSVIEKDIELAMRRYKYAWGEGAGSTSRTGIEINVPTDFQPGTVIGGRGVARTVQLESTQADDATTKLRTIRPNKDKAISGEWTEDSTKKLLEFRQKKAEQVAAKAEAAQRKRGFWARVLDWFRGKPKTAPTSNPPAVKPGK